MKTEKACTCLSVALLGEGCKLARKPRVTQRPTYVQEPGNLKSFFQQSPPGNIIHEEEAEGLDMLQRGSACFWSFKLPLALVTSHGQLPVQLTPRAPLWLKSLAVSSFLSSISVPS